MAGVIEIEARPSQNTQVPYLDAYKNPGKIPGMDYKSYEGYWMIFKSINEIDHAWELIKAATEDGRLGLQSAVRTAMILEDEHPYENKVINVFSYAQDTNTERAKLVTLQELGFHVEELQWKPIESKGLFYHEGDRDFCEPSRNFM